MQINRNNYETFLIDYLDGVLDDRKKQEVEAFLLVNSDIAMEFEAIQSGLVIPKEVKYSEKETLFNIPFSTAKPNDPFFNQKCIEKIEGVLPPGEEQLFEIMVNKSPDHLYAFQTYCKTKLPADYSIYDEKIFIKIDEHNPVLNEQNFTGYAIAYHEGWLNKEARKLVEKHQREHEYANRLFSFIKQLKINPDYSIYYPNKSILKKELTIGQRVQKNIVYWVSIAAILVVGAFAFYTSQTNEFTSHQNVAQHQPTIRQASIEKSFGNNPVITSGSKEQKIVGEKKLIKEQVQLVDHVVNKKSDDPFFETRENLVLTELQPFVAEIIPGYQSFDGLKMKNRIVSEVNVSQDININEPERSEEPWLAEAFRKAAKLGIKQFNKSGKGRVKIERQEEKKRMKVEIETRYFALSTTKTINN